MRQLVVAARVVAGGAVLALASLVFVQSLQPHDAPQGRSGGQPQVRTVPVSRPAPKLPIYYYVVASEEQAKRLMDERMAAADYYGVGVPGMQPVFVVARSQEIYESLRELLDKTAQAGGPPYSMIDLR